MNTNHVLSVAVWTEEATMLILAFHQLEGNLNSTDLCGVGRQAYRATPEGISPVEALGLVRLHSKTMLGENPFDIQGFTNCGSFNQLGIYLTHWALALFKRRS
jgi:hypothetical protein